MPDSNVNNGPMLYVFFGLIATGKSTLAKAWAGHKQLPYYNSDRIRKELAGLKATARRQDSVDAGIYSREFSRKTYGLLRQKAEKHLQHGESVVLDASYQYADDRRELRDLAKNLNCRVFFILCECPEAEMHRRMQQRQQDPDAVSDGRWEVYLKQKHRFEKPDELSGAELIRINTQAPVEKLLNELDRKLV